ncbi:unnamed protein product [Pocillopora meandrina]|uniref:Uncharacterized protein n=1 Tax=Pocillopora meandrina TaxID=46732 RepID=A0AAU9VM11_9CNID|nr:unnamed protein product [Pocillopora meandrina]
MRYDPVGHSRNLTVTTCTDGTTEHTQDDGLGINICCSGKSKHSLCQIGNNDGKSFNYPVREIQAGGPVSLEHFDLEGQQENSGNQDEEEDGILEFHE